MPDPYQLHRFFVAQKDVYACVREELRSGQKRTHWMWFIFPQLRGLGTSDMARRFAISGLPEAEAYLQHPVLGPRLLECAADLLAVEGKTAREILGSPDDLKLRSCATLFAQVSPPGSVFERLLARFFAGEPDSQTLQRLHAESRDA